MMDQYHYERELSLSGVTLESCKENIAGNTIEADMNKGMLALFAQIRSQQSAVDTMRGMVGKAEKCQYLGVPRFGYSHEGDEITLDPVWAPVARRIHTDYLAGVSIEYLARELRDMGATTTRGTEPDYEFVLGILKSTAYAGVYQWGRKRDDRGRVVTDENGDPVPLVYKEGGMPAIVDMDTKMACLRRIGQRKRYAAKADYILVGKLANAETGAPMHGETARGRSGRQYFYYVDKSGGKRVSVRKDAIEAALAEAVRSLLSDKAVVARLVARAASFKREADKSADMALRAARDDLAALERKRANVIDAIAEVTGAVVHRHHHLLDGRDFSVVICDILHTGFSAFPGNLPLFHVRCAPLAPVPRGAGPAFLFLVSRACGGSCRAAHSLSRRTSSSASSHAAFWMRLISSGARPPTLLPSISPTRQQSALALVKKISSASIISSSVNGSSITGMPISRHWAMRCARVMPGRIR